MIQADYIHQPFALLVERGNCSVRLDAQTFAIGDLARVWNTISKFLLITKLAGENQIVIFAFKFWRFIL